MNSITRRLLLLRHAKSAWDTGARNDLERPLAPRGRRDAPRVGRWLHQRALTPDRILCSIAHRTRETLELLDLDVDQSIVSIEDSLYLSTAESLLGIIRAMDDECRILLVIAHNPGLDHLLMGLCGEDLEWTSKGKLMTTATLAVIEMSTEFSGLSAGQCRLEALVRPRDLTDFSG